MKIKSGGQAMLEYAFLAAAIIAGLLLTRIYLKRAIQGRLRSAGESMSDTQYSPGRVDSALRTEIRVDSADTTGLGWSSSSLREVRVRGGVETIYGREN